MFYLLLVTYILGGLTFVPFLALAVIAFTFYTSVPADLKPRKLVLPPDSADSNNDSNRPAPSSLKTWLTVRRTFEPLPSSYISIVRTLLDTRTVRTRRAEDTYYAVLKGTILYLYEDEAMSECAAAIDLRHCDVRIVPDVDLLDGELFAKRNAILLREKASDHSETHGDMKQDLHLDEEGPVRTIQSIHDPHEWYIFFRSVHDMEDWYFALLGSPAPFPHGAQRLLIDALDALPDRIPTRWLNALIGRLFLGVKNTHALEEWVVGRLMKKLSKVKTPSWLTAIDVRSFDAGDAAPILSKPMLKELTPEGEASIGVDVSYIAPQDGAICITLSATAAIALPTPPSLAMLGFKKDREREAERERPYEVSLVLAVIVRRVEGNMLVKIKRAPSNRVWYAFTTMPKMDIEVVPVVSDRQIRWGMVLSGIEGKLREIIQESVVLPYMDDIPFFDTSSLSQRGGIFADAFHAPDHPPPGSTAEPSPPKDLPADLRHTHLEETIVAGVHSSEDGAEIGLGKAITPVHDAKAQNAETIAALGVRGSLRKRRMWVGALRGEDGEEYDDGVGGEVDGTRYDDSHEREHDEDTSTVRVKVTGDDLTTTAVTEDTVQDRERMLLSPRRGSSRSVSESHFISSSSPLHSVGLSTSAPSASVPSPSSFSSPSTPSAVSTSFLATLKSRGAGMAEKQPALKEAMRKWGVGVNWAAGRRKGDNGSSMQRDREREREKEMSADHGDVWSGDDTARRSSSSRGNYADLRRKVQQRERERLLDGGGSTRTITIPSHKEDALGSPEQKPSNASIPLRRTGSDSNIPTSAQASPPVQFLTPSAPKTTTELHTVLRSPSPAPLRSPPSTPLTTPGPSAPFVLTDPPAPSRPTAPIRAQPPKAATMTIPGIHARHRGDLMGFGSGPPAAEPSSGPTGDGQAGRTMQSVYRLLRGGGGNEGGEESQPQTPIDIPTTASRLVPPPLPPRTPASPIAGPSSTAQDTTPPEPTSPSAALSPASQALKSVVEQDAATRQSPSRRSSLSPRRSPRSSISGDLSSPPTPAGAITAPQPITGSEKAWKPPPPPLPPRQRPAKVPEHEDGE